MPIEDIPAFLRSISKQEIMERQKRSLETYQLTKKTNIFLMRSKSKDNTMISNQFNSKN